jgi:hypothetical protein
VADPVAKEPGFDDFFAWRSLRPNEPDRINFLSAMAVAAGK